MRRKEKRRKNKTAEDQAWTPRFGTKLRLPSLPICGPLNRSGAMDCHNSSGLHGLNRSTDRSILSERQMSPG